jgi:hypothetical protein
MARVVVTDVDSRYIAERVAAFSEEAPETLRWHSCYIEQFSALPLYVGWTETIGLRADGELVRWSTEGDYAGLLVIGGGLAHPQIW